MAVLDLQPKPTAEMYILFKGASRDDCYSQVAARATKMNELARVLLSQNRHDDVHLAFGYMMRILVRDEPWRVAQPYSPILAMLQSGLCLNDDEGHLDALAQESSATSTNRNCNQVIIGRQLLEIGGANPNLPNDGLSSFPLYNACYSYQPTNLDFIELLLENGADRNLTCMGGSSLMGALDMSLDAIKLLLSYEHPNCPPIDVNRTFLTNVSALDFVRVYIEKFTRFRNEVARTGKVATGCYKTWTTTEPFDAHIDQLRDTEALLLSKGAVSGGVSAADYKALVSQPDRMPREVAQAALGLHGESTKMSKAFLNFDISSLFGFADLLYGKTSPGWYRDKPAHVKDGTAMVFEAFEGKSHLYSSGGGVRGAVPEAGLRVKLFLFLPNDAYACLTGYVEEALPVPTEKELKRTKRTANPTRLYKRPCRSSRCHHGNECRSTKTGSYAEILQKFGAVHGQEVKCKLKFNQNLGSGDGRDESVLAFFAGYSKFDVNLRFDDQFQEKWTMSRINSVE